MKATSKKYTDHPNPKYQALYEKWEKDFNKKHTEQCLLGNRYWFLQRLNGV